MHGLKSSVLVFGEQTRATRGRDGFFQNLGRSECYDKVICKDGSVFEHKGYGAPFDRPSRDHTFGVHDSKLGPLDEMVENMDA
jgi:hypothetical protein